MCTKFRIDLLVFVEVLNKYLSNLGVKNEDYEFVEIIGFYKDLLAFVPQLVCAILLISPITEEVDFISVVCFSFSDRLFSMKNVDNEK